MFKKKWWTTILCRNQITCPFWVDGGFGFMFNPLQDRTFHLYFLSILRISQKLPLKSQICQIVRRFFSDFPHPTCSGKDWLRSSQNSSVFTGRERRGAGKFAPSIATFSQFFPGNWWEIQEETTGNLGKWQSKPQFQHVFQGQIFATKVIWFFWDLVKFVIIEWTYMDISYGYVSEIGYTHHKITIFRWNEGPITLRILAEVETWATWTYLHNFTDIYRWRGNTSTNMGNHFRKTLKATRSWVAMLVSHVMAPQWLEQKGAWDLSGYCLVTERVISTALHLIPRFESCKNKDLTKCCNGVPCLTSCWKSWTLKFRAGKSLVFLYRLCKSIA